MNTQLIPVVPAVIGHQTVQTVDGRALHTFLEVQTEFSKWMERRIEEYGFIDGQDFSSFLAKSTGGRPTKEYALAIDMAKELSMVERTAKGKEARQYFIECERIALQSASIALPITPAIPVIESSLVLDYQGVPIRFLIALAATKSSGYDDDQVLNTPHVAVPRVDIAVFLCPIGFAPMGEWLVRKAGRTSTCVCSNSPTNALNSVERSLACRSIPA
jgi:phage anti-repressor protein